MKITLREYKKEDFPALQSMIRETWHYDDFCNPKIASKLANVFLSSCLTNYTFSCVALVDTKPIGIILGKHTSIHKCSIKNRIKQITAIISLYMSIEGRKAATIFESAYTIDTQLLNECQKRYPAELSLFAVSPIYRGKGIGKMLFQALLTYMDEQHIKEFYLFTDTSCNYGFYEHQGMVRRCSKEHSFSINGQHTNMNFFIYDYQKNTIDNNI